VLSPAVAEVVAVGASAREIEVDAVTSLLLVIEVVAVAAEVDAAVVACS